MAFAAAGIPMRITLAPWSSQRSPAASALTWALETMGTRSNSKLASVLPGGSLASARWRSKRRRARSAISCSPSAASSLAAGQPSLSARSANCRHMALALGMRSSVNIRSSCAVSTALTTRLPRSAAASSWPELPRAGRRSRRGIPVRRSPRAAGWSWGANAAVSASTSGSAPASRQASSRSARAASQLRSWASASSATASRHARRSLPASSSASKARRYASRGNSWSRYTRLRSAMGLRRRLWITCR